MINQQSLLEKIEQGIKLFSTKEVSYLETGIPLFDYYVGGLPISEISEIHDTYSIGKTSFALQCCRYVTNKDMRAIIFSYEDAISKQILDTYKVNTNNLYLSNDSSTDFICSSVEELDPSLLVIDSLVQLDSNQELKYIDYKKKLRLIKEAVSGRDCAVLVTNQERFSFKGNVTVGGKAIRDFSYLRISLSKGGSVYKRCRQIGNKVNFDVSYRDTLKEQHAHCNLLYNKGFDLLTNKLDLMILKGDIITKAGYYYKDESLLGRKEDCLQAISTW